MCCKVDIDVGLYMHWLGVNHSVTICSCMVVCFYIFIFDWFIVNFIELMVLLY